VANKAGVFFKVISQMRGKTKRFTYNHTMHLLMAFAMEACENVRKQYAYVSREKNANCFE